MRYGTIQLTRNGLGSAWIRNAEEVLQEGRLFFVVPVTQNNGELGVVVSSISFILRVEEERGTQTIDIYPLGQDMSVCGFRKGKRAITFACP